MALLATAAGRTGLLGGLLFILSDSVLAAGQFGIRIPEPLRTAAVIGTYAPAQVLLTAGWWRLGGGGAEPAVPGTAGTAGSLPAAPAGRTGAAA